MIYASSAIEGVIINEGLAFNSCEEITGYDPKDDMFEIEFDIIGEINKYQSIQVSRQNILDSLKERLDKDYITQEYYNEVITDIERFVNKIKERFA